MNPLICHYTRACIATGWTDAYCNMDHAHEMMLVCVHECPECGNSDASGLLSHEPDCPNDHRDVAEIWDGRKPPLHRRFVAWVRYRLAQMPGVFGLTDEDYTRTVRQEWHYDFAMWREGVPEWFARLRWRYARVTVSRRCPDCGEWDVRFGRHTGKHIGCLPF